MIDVSRVPRDCGFETLPQFDRELEDRPELFSELAADIESFEMAWAKGIDQPSLGQKFRFQKVHDAECARRGILLYEIYIQRGSYRAVVAWFQEGGPGYWVTVFKKQGNQQSKVSLKTAGDRAVRRWRQ